MTSSTEVARRRDPRRWIYAGLDLLLAAGYVAVVVVATPNRLPLAQAQLLALPVGAAVMAGGMLGGGRWGWRAACAGAALLLGLAILLLIQLVASAALLAGVYGAVGKSASQSGLVAGALVLEFVALVPALQLAYLRGPGGRRAFGLPPRPGRA